MTDSSPTQRICVHCGTSRSVDEPLCPNCGKPWVDERIGDDAEAPPAGAAAVGGTSDAAGAVDAGDQPEAPADEASAEDAPVDEAPPPAHAEATAAVTMASLADEASTESDGDARQAPVADEADESEEPASSADEDAAAATVTAAAATSPTTDAATDDAADSAAEAAEVDAEEASPEPTGPQDASAPVLDPEDTGEMDVPVAATAATAGGAGATDTFSEADDFDFDDWTLPPEAPKSRARWLIPIILLIAVVIVWVLVFLDDDPSTDTTVAQSPVTTIAPTTTEATTTTAAVTTTTVPETTTTTVDFPPPSAWEPVGDPIPTDELTLRQAAIGPIDFGDSITFAAGRLTASLGEAENATVDDLCSPAESYALQWGELLAIFDGFRSDAALVSYRYEDLGSDRQLGLTTLSGLALGDTVAELKAIYARFTIAFETIEGKDHFRLLDGSELLLWGPVSSTADDGVVEGIYSPSPCEDA